MSLLQARQVIGLQGQAPVGNKNGLLSLRGFEISQRQEREVICVELVQYDSLGKARNSFLVFFWPNSAAPFQ